MGIVEWWNDGMVEWIFFSVFRLLFSGNLVFACVCVCVCVFLLQISLALGDRKYSVNKNYTPFVLAIVASK